VINTGVFDEEDRKKLLGEGKPHLRFDTGEWICYLWPHWGCITIGYGSTPTLAYNSWKIKHGEVK
jgi:hypothetical protein